MAGRERSESPNGRGWPRKSVLDQFPDYRDIEDEYDQARTDEDGLRMLKEVFDAAVNVQKICGKILSRKVGLKRSHVQSF